MHLCAGGVCGIGCGGVGVRSRQCGGGFRLIGKHARIEICLLIPMFLGVGYLSMYTKISGLV